MAFFGTTHVIAYNNDGCLFKLNALSGAIEARVPVDNSLTDASSSYIYRLGYWTSYNSGPLSNRYPSPVVDKNGVIHIGSSDGTAYAINGTPII